uniref:SAM domain-containing protein n=1 Tax=Glossina pallidipes TaxID=7398 RepID=A0A1A9Z5W8_GLOPL
MRYLYKDADEKFVREKTKRKKCHALDSYQFRLNSMIYGKSDFNKKDTPIAFKTTPDTLLMLCSIVVDKYPLSSIYEWTIEDICRWLRRRGYPHYQNTFRENLINGRTFLLLDTSALAAMNIKYFDHARDIAYGIRTLFYYEMTKFGRSITLAPDFHLELYKLFRIKTGAKYEKIRRSDLWHRMQLIRAKTPTCTHWEILERWMTMTKSWDVRVGYVPRQELYECAKKSKVTEQPTTNQMHCFCLPPCCCYWTEKETRFPWRLECLPHLPPFDSEIVMPCEECPVVCTCRWSSKKYKHRTVLSCLQQYFPQKYGSPFVHSTMKLNKGHGHRLSLYQK